MRRKKMGKPRFAVFFQWFVAPAGRKVGSGAEPFGQMRDEKLHAVLARSTFGSQHVQNTPFLDHFWKLRCRKKCTPLSREAHFQVKILKAPHARTTFGSSDVVLHGRRKECRTLSKVSKT